MWRVRIEQHDVFLLVAAFVMLQQFQTTDFAAGGIDINFDQIGRDGYYFTFNRGDATGWYAGTVRAAGCCSRKI